MAYCPNCGAEVQGSFCAKCGSSVAGGAAPSGGQMGSSPSQPATQPQSAGLQENVAGALCYLLGILTGIIFLVLAPYNQMKSVRFHAFQSIFFGIGVFVIYIVLMVASFILAYIPVLGAIVAMLLYVVVWLGSIVLWLYLMYSTYNGKKVVLPVIGAIAEKQA